MELVRLHGLIASLRDAATRLREGCGDDAGVRAALLTFADLRAANREAWLQIEADKTRVLAEGSKTDSVHLVLQNLLYERAHLRRQIETCRDFATPAFDSIALVPEAEFLAAATESVDTAALADPTQLTLARLRHESQLREGLGAELRAAQGRLRELRDRNADKARLLDSLPGAIGALEVQTRPLRAALGLQPTPALAVHARAAARLPAPLRLAFRTLSASVQAVDAAARAPLGTPPAAASVPLVGASEAALTPLLTAGGCVVRACGGGSGALAAPALRPVASGSSGGGILADVLLQLPYPVSGSSSSSAAAAACGAVPLDADAVRAALAAAAAQYPALLPSPGSTASAFAGGDADGPAPLSFTLSDLLRPHPASVLMLLGLGVPPLLQSAGEATAGAVAAPGVAAAPGLPRVLCLRLRLLPLLGAVTASVDTSLTPADVVALLADEGGGEPARVAAAASSAAAASFAVVSSPLCDAAGASSAADALGLLRGLHGSDEGWGDDAWAVAASRALAAAGVTSLPHQPLPSAGDAAAAAAAAAGKKRRRNDGGAEDAVGTPAPPPPDAAPISIPPLSSMLRPGASASVAPAWLQAFAGLPASCSSPTATALLAALFARAMAQAELGSALAPLAAAAAPPAGVSLPPLPLAALRPHPAAAGAVPPESVERARALCSALVGCSRTALDSEAAAAAGGSSSSSSSGTAQGARLLFVEVVPRGGEEAARALACFPQPPLTPTLLLRACIAVPWALGAAAAIAAPVKGSAPSAAVATLLVQASALCPASPLSFLPCDAL